MSEPYQIVLIDNRHACRQQVTQALADMQLSCAESTDDINSLSSQADCLIVACDDDFIQSSKDCETYKKADLPLIFILSDKSGEAHVRGYEFCLLDSLDQPYGKQLFHSHIKKLIEQHRSKCEQQESLNEVTNAMLALQNDNSRLHDICRFLQHSFYCDSIHTLCDELFAVTRDFGTAATLYIHSDKHHFFIADGPANELNQNILTMLVNERRIFQFGRDRAVFNWNCASLLVNKLGSNVDNLAMLMDGFEAGFFALEGVDEFHQVLKKYRKQNEDMNFQVTSIVENVAAQINMKLSEFGSETSLTLEQEEALQLIGESSREQVDALFYQNVEIEQELNEVITNMRTQKQESQSKNEEDGGIDFF